LNSAGSSVRLAELVASLSLATDLAMGHALEHGLGVCLLGIGLGEEAGLDDDELGRVWYSALLRHSGCTADNHVLAALVGDEISFSAGAAGLDRTSPAAWLPYLVRSVLRASGPVGLARLPAAAGTMREAATAVCEVAEVMAERLGLDAQVQRGLALGAERWDGKGFLRRAAGEEIPLAVRVVQVAEVARAAEEVAGPDAVAAVLRSRAGKALDPSLVETFCARRGDLLARLDAGSAWDAALEAEPGAQPTVTGGRLDSALRGLGEFADLKSPYTGGHSSGVAALAEAAAERAGVPAVDLRRAAFVHDVGRAAVPAAVWEKRGPLGHDERERVRLHPYHTERVLARCSEELAALAGVASLHHERLDGSGYHRGAGRGALPPAARILAVADAYHAMIEPRPHRAALAPETAAAELRSDVRGGRLDADAVEAVLAAAGQPAPRRRTSVAGLTARELEVLRLLARGRSKREIAAALTIAPKTADAHVQHIYAKVGVSTRAAAALFAMRHDLLEPDGR
jgi:HD-GYP domain-containing protein (c-di-GMP phosphodiesterase class II)